MSEPEQMPAVLSGDVPVSSEDQPWLIDPAGLPMRPDLVELVKAKKFEHTGKIVSKDEELCRDVCRDLIYGMSGRQIAKKYRISRSTVLSIERVMRARGELGPLTKQVIDRLDNIIVLGLERYQEAIEAGEIHPGQLPIPMGVMIDKRGQLAAGVVPGTERTVSEVSADQVRSAWEKLQALKPVKVVTVDAPSIGDGTQVVDKQGA